MAYIEQWLSTMSLILRRKRFKFQVDLSLTDMRNVPFVNAVLYCKIRLHDGGSFCDHTVRSDVINHHVCWGKECRFVCRIGSDPQSGMLEPCICRVSVRKEVKGGRSFQKLGYVDINLSEFAASGIDGFTRTYLLEGYNAGQQRQDNSLLRVNISMVLLSADPCFKVPPNAQRNAATSTEPVTVVQELAAMSDRASLTSASSGFESLNRCPPSIPKTYEQCTSALPMEFVKGRQDLGEHCRNASRTSQVSQMSDYTSSSVSHSRQSSSGSSQTPRAGLVENMSSIFAATKGCTVKKVVGGDANTSREFNSSRVDAAELITELLKDYNTASITTRSTEEGNLQKSIADSGLKLFVSTDDRSAAIVGSSENLPVMKSKRFTPVVMEPPPR